MFALAPVKDGFLMCYIDGSIENIHPTLSLLWAAVCGFALTIEASGSFSCDKNDYNCM